MRLANASTVAAMIRCHRGFNNPTPNQGEKQMANKFTPGPWEVFKRPLGQRHGIESKQCSIVTWGAECDDAGVGGDSQEETDANAQLISAAPDLLEACENFVYGRKEARECEAEMRAAIAKATGAK